MATGNLTLRLPPPILALTGTYWGPIGTDITDDTGGWIMAGGGYLTFEPAIVEPPPTLVLGDEYDVAVALPTPDMVDGRAT